MPIQLSVPHCLSRWDASSIQQALLDECERVRALAKGSKGELQKCKPHVLMEGFDELDEAFDEVTQAIYKLNKLIEKQRTAATCAPTRRCDTQAQGAHVQDAQSLKKLRREPSDNDDDSDELLALLLV